MHKGRSTRPGNRDAGRRTPAFAFDWKLPTHRRANFFNQTFTATAPVQRHTHTHTHTYTHTHTHTRTHTHTHTPFHLIPLLSGHVHGQIHTHTHTHNQHTHTHTHWNLRECLHIFRDAYTGRSVSADCEVNHKVLNL